MIRKAGGGWSAPAFIAPNNLSGGFLIGLDAFNAIIILNSDEAVKGFKSHQFTLGAEVGQGLSSFKYDLIEHNRSEWSLALSVQGPELIAVSQPGREERPSSHT